MAFSERTKLIAKNRSAHRCCICHAVFVEVHHIVPQELGGSDELDNAAPLCASCHDLYGGNPDKRKSVRQMRDRWWKSVEERDRRIYRSTTFGDWLKIDSDPSHHNKLKATSIALYHVVFADENFDTSAQILANLIRKAQSVSPGQPRRLFLDIDGHRNSNGGFDHDMFELQINFVAEFLSQWLTSAHMPLVEIEFNHTQRNDFPEQLNISGELGQKDINSAIDGNAEAIWISDKAKWIYLE
ncbi:MAG: HNH endonuclease [Pseudoxanthomonas sp.]